MPSEPKLLTDFVVLDIACVSPCQWLQIYVPRIKTSNYRDMHSGGYHNAERQKCHRNAKRITILKSWGKRYGYRNRHSPSEAGSDILERRRRSGTDDSAEGSAVMLLS